MHHKALIWSFGVCVYSVSELSGRAGWAASSRIGCTRSTHLPRTTDSRFLMMYPRRMSSMYRLGNRWKGLGWARVDRAREGNFESDAIGDSAP